MHLLQARLHVLLVLLGVQYQAHGNSKKDMTLQDCLSLVSQLSLGLHKISSLKSCNTLPEPAVPRDCNAVYDNGIRKSGVYKIKPANEAFDVFCNMSHGGGWTAIQRRVSNEVNFYRGWNDYVKGFGDLKGNFWLGLDKIHQLTSKVSRLRVDMLKKGNYGFAEYTNFRIANSTQKYKLYVSDYSGNAGDSLSYHHGMYFTTKDRDNDQYSGNCAIAYHGAWWYRKCHWSNLNGKYLNAQSDESVAWYHFGNNFYSLENVEMKVKR